MADDHEDRFRRHEAIMAGLARMLEAQHHMNEEQRAMNMRMEAFVTQQLEFNADVRTTLARLETIVARMGQQSENGNHA